MRSSLTLPAPAKVNLYLRVTGIRQDGMHELDTAFAFVDTGDVLHVRKASALTVTCSRPHLAGKRNLVQRVLAAARRAYGVSSGLFVHIDKRLPEQAGLGGGSSDAATALLAANHLWRLGLTAAELIDFATTFGADIPCFLFGHASLASGIGEKLTPWHEPLPPGHCLLAYPGFGLATAAVFRRFDAQEGQLTRSGGGDTIRDRRPCGGASPSIGDNELETAAVSLAPGLGRLLNVMRSHARMAWMSGSGSACVAVVDGEAAARRLKRRLRQEGLATWTHIGRLLAAHPLAKTCVRPADWGVAKW